MKATDEQETKTEEVKESKQLVKMTEIKPKFAPAEQVLQTMNEYCLSLEIKEDSDLVVANNNASMIVKVLKGIDERRKELKKPYAEAVKLIDEYVRTSFTDPLEKAKATINGAITNYKVVQEAAARIEAEKKREEIAKETDEKAVEADRIVRIMNQLIARLYGGSWMNKEGQMKTSSGCQNPRDCDDLLTIISNQAPKPSEFVYYEDNYKASIRDLKSKISKYKALFIERQSESAAIRENAAREIENIKMNSQIEVNNNSDELRQEVIADARKAFKETEKSVKEAGKGVRKTLKFEVVDIVQVPKEWLILDEAKVREFAQKHKEDIKAEMKKGNNIMYGLKFWVEEKYVSR